MIHFFCPVTGSKFDRVYYVDDEEIPEGKDLLEMVKAHMKLMKVDRFVFDGVLYEYAHGSGRWYRAKWTGEISEV